MYNTVGFFDDDDDEQKDETTPKKGAPHNRENNNSPNAQSLPRLPKLSSPQVEPIPRLDNPNLPHLGQSAAPKYTPPAPIKPIIPIKEEPQQRYVPEQQKYTPPEETRRTLYVPPHTPEPVHTAPEPTYIPPAQPEPPTQRKETQTRYSQPTGGFPSEPKIPEPTVYHEPVPEPPKQRMINIAEMNDNFKESTPVTNDLDIDEALGLGQEIKKVDLGEAEFGELSDEDLMGTKKTTSSSSNKKNERAETPKKVKGKGFARGNRDKNAIDNAGPNSINPVESRINQTPKPILFLRFAVATIIIASIVIAGKTAFFPQSFPSQEAVISTVKEGIGITDFPTDDANAIVLDFTRTYLNVDSNEKAASSMTARDNLLKTMIASNVELGTVVVNDEKPVKVGINSGPYITAVSNIDNNNAQYDVMAKLSTNNWIKLRIPVFYNEKSFQFIISSAPTFLETPQLSPDIERFETITDWVTTDPAIEQITPDLQGYFAAWGKSDSEVLLRYLTPNPTREASFGLNGALKYMSIDEVSTRHPFKDDMGEPDMTRKAVRVTVTWTVTNNPTATYVQAYDLLMIKDKDKWFVNDLRSGQNVYSTDDKASS